MSKPRLTEALRRLRDRAAAVALSEGMENSGNGNLHTFLRQAIAEETRNSGFGTAGEMRARLDELERKVEELFQILGTFESEPPPPMDQGRLPSPVTAEAPQVYGNFQPAPRRRRGIGIVAAVVIAALAAIAIMLAATGYIPAAWKLYGVS